MGAFGGCAQGAGAFLVPGRGGGEAGAPTAPDGGTVTTGGEIVATGGEIIVTTGGGGGAGAEGGAPPSTCRPEETLCAGACVNLLTDLNNCGACTAKCTGAEICNLGTCDCPYELCPPEVGVCTDTSTSKSHCGDCNTICRAEEACIDGVCSCPDESYTRCGSLCTNLQTDLDNCGACDNACAESQVCSQGECRDDCVAPETKCENPNGSVYCADLQTDAEHCGDCRLACEVGFACVAGICDCAPGTMLCGTLCVDTMNSLQHCGGCDTNCTKTCLEGVCVCEGGLVECGTSCFDLQTDNTHCGACNNPCLAGSSCVAGSCVCDEGLTFCEGAPESGCVDLLTDVDYCGTCGTACGEDASCLAGVCVCDDEDETYCSGDCADLAYSADHCGGCGQACDPGQICQESSCATPALVPRSNSGAFTPGELENKTDVRVRLCNQSSTSVTLTGVTFKFWYTADGSGTTQTPVLDWSEKPATMTAERLDPKLTSADWVAIVAVTGTASLAANTCSEFQGNVHGGTNWPEGYKIDNDWSYLAGDFQVNENITIYQNDNLIWGTEPPPLATESE
ncbi:MAG: hypothetical protein JW751_30890 [Polyangiaceae bacterium]|nr:hypothetical protein [Polyangiaceae bacterium]